MQGGQHPDQLTAAASKLPLGISQQKWDGLSQGQRSAAMAFSPIIGLVQRYRQQDGGLPSDNGAQPVVADERRAALVQALGGRRDAGGMPQRMRFGHGWRRD